MPDEIESDSEGQSADARRVTDEQTTMVGTAHGTIVVDDEMRLLAEETGVSISEAAGAVAAARAFERIGRTER